MRGVLVVTTTGVLALLGALLGVSNLGSRRAETRMPLQIQEFRLQRLEEAAAGSASGSGSAPPPGSTIPCWDHNCDPLPTPPPNTTNTSAPTSLAPTFMPLNFGDVQVPYYCYPMGNCPGLWHAMKQKSYSKVKQALAALTANHQHGLGDASARFKKRLHKFATADEGLSKLLDAEHGSDMPKKNPDASPHSPIPNFLRPNGDMQWSGAYTKRAPFVTDMAKQIAGYHGQLKPHWAEDPVRNGKSDVREVTTRLSSPIPNYLKNDGTMQWSGAYVKLAPFASNMDQQIASYHGLVEPHNAEDPKTAPGKPDVVPLDAEFPKNQFRIPHTTDTTPHG